MTQSIHSMTLDNGVVLLAALMDWVESAAFTILLPAGCVYDPDDGAGLANLTCEMVQRGAGGCDSRQFVEALDARGADRMSSVSQSHTSFSSSMLAEDLDDVLALYADLVRHPRMPVDQLEDGRQVCFQEIQSIEDDLAQRAMQQLRFLTYDAPWGRSCTGDRDTVGRLTHGDVEQFFRRHYLPEGTIISVAGKVQWPHVQETVEALFGDWKGNPPAAIATRPARGGYEHIAHDSSQTQIGIAYPSVPYRDADYFQARGAVGVLSDGMSSRLFTEVREKRGLCYSVYASYHSLRDEGRILCYAGTSTERAQETLDVMEFELRRLSDGIEESELQRLKARVKSALIMQQESSIARSGAIAGDWYHLHRIRPLLEVQQIVDQLSCESIGDYLASHVPENLTVVTLGAADLEMPDAVS